jgi:drug/metabolite transporter (DMT)-like permease
VLGALALAGRTAISARPRDLPLLAVIGAGDVGANAAMAVASTHGLLSVVAVLSSLYPAVTVLLARIVHAERLSRVQGVGVVAALVGVSLIASGGGVG